jgi:hypothetical protein
MAASCSMQAINHLIVVLAQASGSSQSAPEDWALVTPASPNVGGNAAW